MTAPYVLLLTAEQTQELECVREKHPVPHFRVKAAALLKVAEGYSIEWVRQHGLLRPVSWETVKNWIVRYQQEGVAGWKVKAGRGKKPSFFPCGSDRRAGQSQS